MRLGRATARRRLLAPGVPDPPRARARCPGQRRRRPGARLRRAPDDQRRHRHASTPAPRARGGHGDHRRRHRRHGRHRPRGRAGNGARPAHRPHREPLFGTLRDARRLLVLHAADAGAARRRADHRAAAEQPADDAADEPAAARRPHRGAARAGLGAARRRRLLGRHPHHQQERGRDRRHARGPAPRFLRHHAGLAAARRQCRSAAGRGLPVDDAQRRNAPHHRSRCADPQRRRRRHASVAGARGHAAGRPRDRRPAGAGVAEVAGARHPAPAGRHGNRRGHRLGAGSRWPRLLPPHDHRAELVRRSLHRRLEPVLRLEPGALRAAHPHALAALPARCHLSHRRLPPGHDRRARNLGTADARVRRGRLPRHRQAPPAHRPGP